MLKFYLVGELTHMRSMCVGVAETGVGAADDPRRIIKKLFFIVLFSDEKYQKSSKRAFPSL